MFDVLVHSGMKSVVPEPVTPLAGAASVGDADPTNYHTTDAALHGSLSFLRFANFGSQMGLNA
jgi:hypothetical protein